MSVQARRHHHAPGAPGALCGLEQERTGPALQGRPMPAGPLAVAPPRGAHGLRRSAAIVLSLALAGCMIGPDFHKPSIEIPTSFKQGVDWQRSAANPQGALASRWWLAFHDDTLTDLVERSLQANQAIVAAEAAYRLAQAQVAASTATLYPVVTAGLSGSRSGGTSSNSASAANTASTGTLTTGASPRNLVSASAVASWEPDLWGQIRREIEASKQSAQASDAQLAGERLSIAASVAADYFELRELDLDSISLRQQQQIDARILDMTRASVAQGTASNDTLLVAQDTLENIVSALQATLISREQYEHALATLQGVAPAALSIAVLPDYTFPSVQIPLAVPAVLLQRRPDVIAAERTAAAANARIGAAQAAFFPTVTLSAQGGFQHNTFANLFSMPNRFWTLGPDLAATIFDGGARSAAVKEARATYDEDVANYRSAVLTAFQNVEDSLSAVNHVQIQASALQNIYQRNRQLFASQQAQFGAGTVSEENVLTQQLTLLSAQQSVADTQGQLAQSAVGLIKNLGGGWQWDDAQQRGVAADAGGDAGGGASAPSAAPGTQGAGGAAALGSGGADGARK
jgi:NodT family efflux transporter outer membrane factor (OMF) lipoprotein